MSNDLIFGALAVPESNSRFCRALKSDRSGELVVLIQEKTISLPSEEKLGADSNAGEEVKRTIVKSARDVGCRFRTYATAQSMESSPTPRANRLCLRNQRSRWSKSCFGEVTGATKRYPRRRSVSTKRG